MNNLNVDTYRTGSETDGHAAEDLRRLLEVSPCACIAVDAAGFVLHANRQALDMLRYRPGELPGSLCTAIVPAERDIELRLQLECCLHGDIGAGDPVPSAIVLRRDGTVMPIELSMELAYTGGTRVIILALRESAAAGRSMSRAGAVMA